jgi:hypothetical protein
MAQEAVVIDEEEVDGFVVVDLESDDSLDAKQIMTERAKEKKAVATTKSRKETVKRREANNIYLSTEVDPKLFASEYEVQFAWPETGKEPVTFEVDKPKPLMSKSKQLLKLLGALHPPYALDDDAPGPVKTGRKSYHLSLDEPLNLFKERDDIEDIATEPVEAVVTPPYACTKSKVGRVEDSTVGTHKIYKGRGPQPENIPDSEYHDAFVWGSGAEQLMDKHPDGIANKKKHIGSTSEKNIQFTVGGSECDWEDQIEMQLQKQNAVPVPDDIENEDINMGVTKTMVAAINAGKVKSTGTVDSSKAPPLKITKKKATKGTRKVDSALIRANESAKERRANAVMKSAERKAERDYQYSNRSALESYVGKENFSVASELSDMSPIKQTNKPPLPFRPSTGKSNKKVQKITPEMHGNPILKNQRYPNLSDAQANRWKSETKLRFTGRTKKN